MEKNGDRMIKTFIDNWSDAQYQSLLDKELIIGGGVKSFIGSFEITYIPPSLKDLENMKNEDSNIVEYESSYESMKEGVIKSFDRLWERLHNIDKEFNPTLDENGNRVIE